MTQQRSSIESREKNEEGAYALVFLYRIPKKKHDSFKDVEEKLAKIYRKHGMLGSRIYQLGKTNTEGFTGFEAFDKALSVPSDEELWIETGFYPSEEDYYRIVASIGQDQAAGPLWGEMVQITGGRQTLMGEFARLA
jgi:uncharacterized protein YbaA (DUF1428 family)